MTFNKRIQLPVRMIQKVFQASFITFAALLAEQAVLGGIRQDKRAIGSLVLGIVLWLIPNCYFATKVMSLLKEVSSRALLIVFYRAELIKLLLTGFIFIAMVKLLAINFPLFFSGYLVAQLVFWLLLITKSKDLL